MNIADELRELLDAQDGRTLIEMREAEPHYDVIVQKATTHDDGSTSVQFDGGIGMLLNGPAEVGDTITIWDGHHELLAGGERHGWARNGELVEWLTPLERIARHVEWLARYDREQRERLEAGAEKRAAQYDALPAPLKQRLDRFAAERPDFWKDSGDYELFCCVEAAKIAEHLRPRAEAGEDPEALVRGFHDLPWEQQKSVVDGGHSGNTFGGACSLALALLNGAKV